MCHKKTGGLCNGTRQKCPLLVRKIRIVSVVEVVFWGVSTAEGYYQPFTSFQAEGNAITVLTTNYVEHSQMLYVWKPDGGAAVFVLGGLLNGTQLDPIWAG